MRGGHPFALNSYTGPQHTMLKTKMAPPVLKFHILKMKLMCYLIIWEIRSGDNSEFPKQASFSQRDNEVPCVYLHKK